MLKYPPVGTFSFPSFSSSPRPNSSAHATAPLSLRPCAVDRPSSQTHWSAIPAPHPSRSFNNGARDHAERLLAIRFHRATPVILAGLPSGGTHAQTPAASFIWRPWPLHTHLTTPSPPHPAATTLASPLLCRASALPGNPSSAAEVRLWTRNPTEAPSLDPSPDIAGIAPEPPLQVTRPPPRFPHRRRSHDLHDPVASPQHRPKSIRGVLKLQTPSSGPVLETPPSAAAGPRRRPPCAASLLDPSLAELHPNRLLLLRQMS